MYLFIMRKTSSKSEVIFRWISKMIDCLLYYLNWYSLSITLLQQFFTELFHCRHFAKIIHVLVIQSLKHHLVKPEMCTSVSSNYSSPPTVPSGGCKNEWQIHHPEVVSEMTLASQTEKSPMWMGSLCLRDKGIEQFSCK